MFDSGWHQPERRCDFSIHFEDGEIPYESTLNLANSDGTERKVAYVVIGGERFERAER